MARKGKTEKDARFNIALGGRIETLRKRRQMKVTTLAQMLGVSRRHIYNYETGAASVPIELLPRLSFVLDVDMDELLAPVVSV